VNVVTGPASKNVLPQDLADLLWSTDPKLNGYMFGTMPTLHKIIQSEWSGDAGLFSHRQAFTAARDGDILGLLIGHTEDEYARNFDVSSSQQPAALAREDAAHLAAALFWMDRLFPVPRPGSYYILEFAVSPQAQGAGIASQLFNAAEARAIERGCAQICLDVAADNAAVDFYRHLGFQTDVETRIPVLDENHGIGRHLHMVRDIAKVV
jgi:ribosomal protein S18 acetylase RimI-like enzyme